MFRDRTNLYIAYRRSHPHSRYVDEEAEVGLMDETPPAFHDLLLELDEALRFVEQQTVRLEGLYQKNILPGFNDRLDDEQAIERCNYLVTRRFQQCHRLVQQFDSMRRGLSAEQQTMLDNMKKGYAVKVQSATAAFRRLQGKYIQFLKDDSGEVEEAAIEKYSRDALSQTQVSVQQDETLAVREREIAAIAQGVLEVSGVFREMQTLVLDQGTVLDRIDYNVGRTVEELKGAERQLNRAEVHQKNNQRCRMILLMVLMVLVVVMGLVVWGKYSSHHSSAPAAVPPPAATTPAATTAASPEDTPARPELGGGA